jgi:hypothetical protein
MKAADSFKPFALVAVAVLAGCGSQSQVGTGAFPGDSAVSGVSRRASTSGNDLLYGSILTSAGDVAVYTYPKGALQATFSTPNDSISSGMCADANGNVFVTAYGYPGHDLNGYVFEYQHGATTPSASLSEGAYMPVACAVDPTTGNLAVANFYYNQSEEPTGNVAIFTDAQGQPSFFTDSAVLTYLSVTYDGQSNLYLLGSHDGLQTYQFAELPAGSGNFTNISVPGLPNGTKRPQFIQWDGQFVAVLGGRIRHGKHSDPVIYRVSTSGSSGTVVGTTKFHGLGDNAGRGFWIQGNQVVLQDGHKNGHELLGIFDYPTGGKPTQTIKTGSNYVVDFAVSGGGSR